MINKDIIEKVKKGNIDLQELNLSEEDMDLLFQELAKEDIKACEIITKEDFYIDDFAKEYLSEILKIKLLTPDEEKDLIFKASKGDIEAKKKLVEANLRLVAYIARLYTQKNDFLDLVQEGNLGLIKAIERFDLNKGCRLSTYASWWIKHYIKDAQRKNMNISRGDFNDIKRIGNYENNYLAKNGEYPTLEEVGKALNISNERILKLRISALENISLNAPLDNETSLIINNMSTENDQAKNITDKLYFEDIIELMKQNLSDRSYKIICLRFGFIIPRPMKLEEIGSIYNISNERVRQIISEALQTIRKAISKKEKVNTLKI